MSFDKSKFVAREGDSEGFTASGFEADLYRTTKPGDLNYYGRPREPWANPTGRLKDEPWRLGEVYGNPNGWQEVDGVKLPPVGSWAHIPSKLDLITDEVLEAAFQEWLRNSTKPALLDAYRARLRQRINDMVEKAQQPVDSNVDLRDVR